MKPTGAGGGARWPRSGASAVRNHRARGATPAKVTGVDHEVRWAEATVVAALRDWAQRYGEVPTAQDWDRSRARRHGEAARLARLNAHPTPVPSVSTVLGRFGSWKAAVATAELPARSRMRR